MARGLNHCAAVLHALVISDVLGSPELVAASTDLMRGALTDAGCSQVTHASSIDDGLGLVPSMQPDLLVLDLLEPLAFEGYRRVITRLRGAPVLAIVPEAQMQCAFDAGIDDCIARPVRRPELVARASAAIRLRVERARRSKRDRRLTAEMRALQREKLDLERIVCVDSLTGVANRRHALALLEAEWKRSAREGTTLSLVMLDLDFFHAYNETYGHPGGDRCLRRVAAEMVMCLRRPSDFLGRYGGEEFIAVLANTDAAGAKLVADRLRTAVEALALPHATSSCSPFVTISVGFATAKACPDRPLETFLHAADRALLAAKSHGRNRVVGDAPAADRAREEAPRIAANQPWARFPAVVVDPWFASRIPAFLAATRADMSMARQACTNGQLDRVRVIARRLKATASEHAIEALGDLATILERTSRGDDRLGTERAISEIEQYVAYVQVTYRRPLERTLDPTG